MKFDSFQPMQRATVLTVLSVILLLAIYHETLFSIISIWRRSETFAHCFLIFPISSYLIWKRKDALACLTPCPDYRPLALIALLGFGWLMANMAHVTVVEQFSLVIMIPLLVWTVLGWRVAYEIAFPLLFLLFSVPFGEFLLPALIGFTADFTVGMLKLTGIPVYREGTYFTIPSGNWSVVEACSGLRYLIASITLGCLFAYFNYNSFVKRAIFIALAAIVPIFANGFRAYMIVMIAHLSDMTLALGVDHFIYGWVFFGIVMALLFWIGSLWAEEPVLVVSSSAEVNKPQSWHSGWEKRMALSAICALMIATIWPLRGAYIEQVMIAAQSEPVKLVLPEPISPWHRTESMTLWMPNYTGATVQERVFYTDDHHTVGVFIMYYRLQEQGKELVNSQNTLVPEKRTAWKVLNENPSAIHVANSEMQVLQAHLHTQWQELLIWRWYWIAGKDTINDYIAKFLQASNKLLGRPSDEAGIILAADIRDDLPTTRASLQNFVDVMLPSIKQSLNKASQGQIP